MLDYLTILTRKITILIINTCAVNTGSSSRFSLLILLYIILFIYIITLVTAGILLYKEISKNIKQKLENEHLEIYSQEYKNILKTVQARQHEFNNHINNITPLYNFINDTLVSESTVLRHLLRHLILYWFRLFP